MIYIIIIFNFLLGPLAYSKSPDCNNVSKLKPNEQLMCCFFRTDYPSVACVQDAIDKGADPKQSKDENGTTPLMYSARIKGTKVWDLLVDKSDINATDKEGRTVLHYAAMGQRSDKIKNLLENKKVQYIGDTKRYTPLAYLLYDVNSGGGGSNSWFLSDNFIDCADALFKYDTGYQKLFEQLKGKTAVYEAGKTKFKIPSDTQIVFFGERHSDKDDKLHDVSIITQKIVKDIINSYNLSYYATEFIPAVQQNKVDLINKGFLPIEVALKKDELLVDKNNRQVDEGKGPDPIAFSQIKFPIMRMYYPDLYKYINDKHIKIIALDIRTKDNTSEISETDGDWATSKAGIETRNAQWVKIIKAIMKSDAKAKILVHGGAAHIIDDPTQPDTVSKILQSSAKTFIIDASLQSSVINYMLHKMGLDHEDAYIYGFKDKFGADIVVRPIMNKEDVTLPEEITKKTSMLKNNSTEDVEK